jgi:hypothetical protein
MTTSTVSEPTLSELTVSELIAPDVPKERTLPDRVRVFLEMRGLLSGQVRVSEEQGAIVLEGTVGLYHERQIALTCAQHVAGVRHVVDRIVVRTRPPLATDMLDR